MRELIISENESSQRLDKFLKKYMDLAPASFFYKMLRKKNITLNGKKAAGPEILQRDDTIRLFLSDETIRSFQSGKTGKAAFDNKGKSLASDRIIYEDRDVLIYNKESGLLVQKGSPEDISLSEELLSYLALQGDVNQESLRAFRPSPAMRIDRNTSGIVLCGKSLAGLQMLSELIRERKIRKLYLAVTEGIPSSVGRIRCAVRKDHQRNTVHLRKLNAKEEPGRGEELCVSVFRMIAEGQGYCLVEAELISGKTHQIRAQLAMLGSPILGDVKYGSRSAVKYSGDYQGQLLHAWKVIFPQDCGCLSKLNKRSFEAELPEVFRNTVNQLFSEDVLLSISE